MHEKYNQVLSHGEKGVVLSLCGRDVPDLEAMAKTASAADSILLSKTILAAAINSQSPEFILRMQHLSEPTKETIKTIIEEMETSTAGITGSSSPTTSTPQIETNGTSNATAMDNDLLLEAQLSKAMTENKRLVSVEKAYREQVARLDRALEENENLKESLKNSQDEVADLKGSARKGSVPQLQEQLRQQSDVIAGQEETIANLERDRKTKQKQIDTLRSSAVKTQNLRDEIDVLKAERDSFAKKANAADKYRQKLQASRQLEQENELLRTELDEVKQWREDTDSAKDRVAGLELAVREYKTTLARSEQDLEELRTTKMRLQHNSEHLSQRVESLLEQQAREQEFIKELQDKLANESPMLAAGALDLDTELANSEKDANALSVAHTRFLWARTLTKVRFLEISKLKAEKEKMGNGAGVGAENVKLQLSLDDTYKKYERLESKYLAVQEEKLELESQIAAIQFGSVSQGYVPIRPKSRQLTHNLGSSEAFLSLQQKWHQANAEVERLKQVVWEITQEMNKTAGKLANAETDCKSYLPSPSEFFEAEANSSIVSLIDKDKLDALKEVKQANSTQVVELGRERDLLVKRVKDLEVDLNLQRDLLNKALLDKDSTQTSLVSKTDELRETEKANARLRATLEILNANSSGRQQGASEALENHIVTISEKLESSRENVAQRAKVVKRSLNEGPSIGFTEMDVYINTKQSKSWLPKKFQKKPTITAGFHAPRR